MYEVRIGLTVLEKAHQRYGDERSADGGPSEFRLRRRAAGRSRHRVRSLRGAPGRRRTSVRSLIVTDSFFGALVFFGVLVAPDVEIAEFEDDPDYWSMVDALE